MSTLLRFPARYKRVDALEADLEAAQNFGRVAAGYIRDAEIVGGESSVFDFMAFRAYSFAVRAGAAARRAIPEIGR